MPKLGIGMDASVTPLRDGKFCLAQTTDFFYPIVDDPYIQGKIACANVLSDLYAMGVPFCDNMLMICGVSNQLTDLERDVVIPLMMKGFKDAANEAGSNVTGGQTVLNPWITIGGVASSVCLPGEIIMPDAAVAGDVLVLTKPLGTQLASLAYQWMITDSDKWKKIQSKFCERDIRKMYHRAMDSMQRLNRTAAQLMLKYKAHAATDVTGFGLKGHAQNLVENQKEKLLFTISTVPVIANVSAVAEVAGMKSRLHAGTLPETSGGLLICLPRQEAALFCEELELLENRRAWIIGEVLAGSGTAQIVESPRIAECPDVDTVGALW